LAAALREAQAGNAPPFTAVSAARCLDRCCQREAFSTRYGMLRQWHDR